jgi:signal transduction histidine kinase
VRDALARTLGDPSLVLGLWLPDRGVWADEHGREIQVSEDRARAVTYVGERLAVLIHDRDLLDQPRLLESVGSAARLALENERLQAQLRAQLAELRDSRTRIIRAGDEERRRLERDLHDGAQQRLLALGMGLQLLKGHVDASSEELLEESQQELQHALKELRELAHGIHPAALTDNGLGDAVRTLAQRAPVPVAVEVDESMGRFPGHVESAAYFVVAEALANVAKYAEATEAWVTVGRENGAAHIEVRDDGNGGATPNRGSGLRGLADRVGALDGQLTIESPPGRGTRIIADIPCTS